VSIARLPLYLPWGVANSYKCYVSIPPTCLVWPLVLHPLTNVIVIVRKQFAFGSSSKHYSNHINHLGTVNTPQPHNTPTQIQIWMCDLSSPAPNYSAIPICLYLFSNSIIIKCFSYNISKTKSNSYSRTTQPMCCYRFSVVATAIALYNKLGRLENRYLAARKESFESR